MAFIDYEDRIKVLVRLGELFRQTDWLTIHEEVNHQNSWFTPQSVDMAIKSWGQTLTKKKILQWLSPYPKIKDKSEVKTILVIMAGNLPLVGLHDLISVFISGNYLQAKLSSKDSILIPEIINRLSEEFPQLPDHMDFSIQLSHNSHQAIIATGSNLTITTLREKYSLIPGLFRGNRHSIAILSGTEDSQTLDNLAMDILSYYGLGCRNASYLLIPEESILTAIQYRLNKSRVLTIHPGYLNSINQQRAILTMNKLPFINGNKILMTESSLLGSAMGVLHYGIYNNLNEVKSFIQTNQNQIQCLIGQTKEIEHIIPFGEAQYPELWDYADGKDTLKFLQDLDQS
ncbi:MAG: hypothetical protein KAH17_06565 [Bacteroidales bacterium]|nr:hypothetical protein [Bacteroidales bacterium]